MKNLLVITMMIFASLSMATDQRRDDDLRPFMPEQDTVKVIKHVFEVLK